MIDIARRWRKLADDAGWLDASEARVREFLSERSG